MKKILITGAGSYIGQSFETYMKQQYAAEYTVDTVDMIDGSWREKSFAEYDTVFHVAGIAHQKETAENAPLYYKVNRDLAVETAQKAKAEGVGQFVFLSSMSVYGVDEGVIEKDTVPHPKSNYGKSKLQAETEIGKLSDEAFRVCILRPPMVYGDDCKGNYRALVKIAKTFPVLPHYKNQRSMISVDRLSGCVKLYIDTEARGIFTPQNEAYVCTCEMIAQIRRALGKKCRTTKIMNPMIRLSVKVTTKGRKAFGNLIYKEFDVLKPCE